MARVSHWSRSPQASVAAYAVRARPCRPARRDAVSHARQRARRRAPRRAWRQPRAASAPQRGPQSSATRQRCSRLGSGGGVASGLRARQRDTAAVVAALPGSRLTRLSCVVFLRGSRWTRLSCVASVSRPCQAEEARCPTACPTQAVYTGSGIRPRRADAADTWRLNSVGRPARASGGQPIYSVHGNCKKTKSLRSRRSRRHDDQSQSSIALPTRPRGRTQAEHQCSLVKRLGRGTAEPGGPFILAVLLPVVGKRTEQDDCPRR